MTQSTVTRPSDEAIAAAKQGIVNRLRAWGRYTDNGTAVAAGLRELFGNDVPDEADEKDPTIEAVRSWVEDTLVRFARANNFCDEANDGIAVALRDVDIDDDSDDDIPTYYDADGLDCRGNARPTASDNGGSTTPSTPQELAAVITRMSAADQQEIYRLVTSGQRW